MISCAAQRVASRGRRRRVVDRDRIAHAVPGLDVSASARFPIVGGWMQRRGGTACHDAVAHARRRPARRRHHRELRGDRLPRDGDRVTGVRTSRGDYRGEEGGRRGRRQHRPRHAVAGIDRMPIESHVPASGPNAEAPLDTVITSAAAISTCRSPIRAASSSARHDGYNSYAQRGNLPVVEDVMSRWGAVSWLRAAQAAALLGRHHGHVDGRSLIVTKGPLPGMYLNCGWCYGGLRPRLPPAGCSPDHRPRRAGTPSTRRSRRPLRPRPSSTKRARARRRGCTGRHADACSYCGPRDVAEFTYQGDANRPRPDPA